MEKEIGDQIEQKTAVATTNALNGNGTAGKSKGKNAKTNGSTKRAAGSMVGQQPSKSRRTK